MTDLPERVVIRFRFGKDDRARAIRFRQLLKYALRAQAIVNDGWQPDETPVKPLPADLDPSKGE